MKTTAATAKPSTDALKSSYGSRGVPVKGRIAENQAGNLRASLKSTWKYIAANSAQVTGMVTRGAKPLEQCQKLGVKTRNSNKQHYYWDNTKASWKIYDGEYLLINNEVILLVPKKIVRSKFYYNTSQYFSRIILEHIQAEKQSINKKGKIIKPSKKYLGQIIKDSGQSKLVYSIEYTKNKPNLLNEYHGRIPQFYLDKGMTDEKLDLLLYN